MLYAVLASPLCDQKANPIRKELPGGCRGQYCGSLGPELLRFPDSLRKELLIYPLIAGKIVFKDF
jgi:hypothetical protein